MIGIQRCRPLLALIGAIALLGAVGFRSAGLPARAADEKAEGPQAPEFPAGMQWLNSTPLTVSGLKGKVLLVDFWEYTCVNCIRTLPYLKAWHERYADKGLTIVGVHAPEFDFARDLANVRRSVTEFGIKYPIVNDREHAIWNRYGNRYWPAKYLFDARGLLRHHHFGEGGYGDTEAQIQKLLREANPSATLPKIMEPIRGEDRPGAVCYPVTPELYAGYQRGLFGNPDDFKPGRVVSFKDSGRHQDGFLYAHGSWQIGPESLRHARATATPQDYVAIRYHAIEVNCVMKPETGKPLKVVVTQDAAPVRATDKGDDLRYDDKGASYLLIDQPRMYRILKNAKFGTYELKLACAQEGLGIYAFTFVSCTAAPADGR